MEIILTTVGFVGLGKLRMACAEVMAEQYEVFGYDIAPRKSETVRVKATLAEAVRGRDIVFVAVQTPHSPEYDGSTPSLHLPPKDFDYSTVQAVLADINQYVTRDQLVVLISTCLPGTTRRELVKHITNARFVYNPYLIAMGSVKWDMVNPEMVIIGTEDGSETTDARELIEFYKPLMQNSPRYAVGTWDEAESIKIFYNTMISTKIGLANMIMDVAVKNGNINVDVVTNALAKSTIRIMSPKYMKAGMGDSGGCHPRDNIALRYLSERLGLGYDLFGAIMGARDLQARNLAAYLAGQHSATGLPVVIHGKAFKPDVDVVDGSYSLLIGHYLDEMGVTFGYVDPLTGDTPTVVGPCICFLAHNRQVTYGYTAAVAEQNLYIDLAPGSIVVDPWRDFSTARTDIQVIHYGNTRAA